jgi:hypothetical protein
MNVDLVIPRTIGAGIGFFTSAPIPLSHRMGARLSITTATVNQFRPETLKSRQSRHRSPAGYEADTHFPLRQNSFFSRDS